MKKILAMAYLSTLLWSCQDDSSGAKSVLGITSKELIVNYKVSYNTDTSYTEFINGLRNVQKQITIDHDTISDEYSCRINFDEYFNLFDKLSIAKNWKLESHYLHFGDAGRPLLLAFEEGDVLGDSIQFELDKSFEGDKFKGSFDYEIITKLFDYQDSVNYLKCLQITDDKMGYFQFVVFDLIGDNYCKFWHSNYGEMSIITSKDQIRELTERKDDFYYKFSSKKENDNEEMDSIFNHGYFSKLTMDKESVLQISPTPEVTLSKGEASVRIVTLSPWQGFLERTFTVSRTFPHIIEQVKLDTILEYHCGIMF